MSVTLPNHHTYPFPVLLSWIQRIARSSDCCMQSCFLMCVVFWILHIIHTIIIFPAASLGRVTWSDWGYERASCNYYAFGILQNFQLIICLINAYNSLLARTASLLDNLLLTVNLADNFSSRARRAVRFMKDVFIYGKWKNLSILEKWRKMSKI